MNSPTLAQPIPPELPAAFLAVSPAGAVSLASINRIEPLQAGPAGSELRNEASKVDPDFLPTEPLSDPDLPNMQKFFTESGHNLRSVFLKYWNEHDGLRRFGYPLSEEHLEFNQRTGNFYITQWFERARFEYHSDQKPPNDVSLGLLDNPLKAGERSFDFVWKLGHRSSFLSAPNSVFVDGKGNIYVNDRGSGRVNKYNSKFKLINYWYLDGSSQAIAGVVSNNARSDGPVLYEVAPARRDVRLLQSDGTWSSLTLQDSGSADQFSPNLGLAVENDFIYVLKYAAYSRYLVWKYKTDGSFVGKFAERSQVTDPTALSVQSQKVYLSDGPSAMYKIFDTGQAGGSDNSSANSNSTEAGQAYRLPVGASNNNKNQSNQNNPTSSALSILADDAGNVWVGGPGSLTRFGSYGRVAGSFGTAGRNAGQLLNPVAIARDSHANLYVADPANHRVAVFDYSGNYPNPAKIEDGPINLAGSLASARTVAVAPNPTNLVLVSDPVNSRIQVFSLTGKYQAAWTAVKISQLAVSSDNKVYALNSAEGLLTQYDLTGKELTRWGGVGSEDGKFIQPGGVAVGTDGAVYVADTGNQRIQKFDANGKFLSKWGSKGSGTAQFGGDNLSDIFAGPTSLTVEPGTGNLYVVDSALHRLQKFKPDGSFIREISQLILSQPFEPVALAAPVAKQMASTSQAGNGGPADFSSSGIYIATRTGLYKIDPDDKLTATLFASVSSTSTTSTVPSISNGGNEGIGDNGDGGVNNLNGLAVTEDGLVFATDSYSRLQKFRLR